MLATIAAVTVAVIVILAALWYMRRKMREDFDEATEHIDSGDPDAAHVKEVPRSRFGLARVV